ncbi:MAG: hypothetical protein IJE14_09915 [Clostridia bacterium]|nr:hypothetical protein [Clostridia bacterium]
MKKLVSIILCAALLFGTVAIGTQASEDEIKWDGDPVVFLQGFTGSPFVLDRGLETETGIWGAGAEFDTGRIVAAVPPILIGLVSYILGGESDLLISGIDYLVSVKLGQMACNPDGTSKYNVTPYPYYAEEASIATLKANGKADFVPEQEINGYIAEYVPEESIYIFNTDWRLGQIDNSERLAEFIDDVLEITGKDKVDIYALSHGGQTAAAYLYYHGEEGKVDNALLDVPAIGGTSIVKGLLGLGAANFDMDEISRFANVLLRTEADLRWLGKILPGEFLNELLKIAFVECFQPYAMTFGSVWDFMDIESYTQLKEMYLNPLTNAKMIEKHDKMHYDCMVNMSEGLKAAEAAGANIYILSNCGTRLGSGEAIDADFVIDTTCSSGAYTAEFGTQFPADYKQKNTTCTDPTHNHISPGRTIDASCAFLPEKTWFIKGQYHGMIYWDSYTRPLIVKMLLTDDIVDVRSDPDYPQFELGQNPVDAVYAKFTNETSGFYNSESNALLVRNLSEKYSITVKSVEAEGCEFTVDKSAVIAPGEELEIPCTKLSGGNIKVDITYVRKGEFLTSPFTKTVYFCAK